MGAEQILNFMKKINWVSEILVTMAQMMIPPFVEIRYVLSLQMWMET